MFSYMEVGSRHSLCQLWFVLSSFCFKHVHCVTPRQPHCFICSLWGEKGVLHHRWRGMCRPSSLHWLRGKRRWLWGGHTPYWGWPCSVLCMSEVFHLTSVSCVFLGSSDACKLQWVDILATASSGGRQQVTTLAWQSGAVSKVTHKVQQGTSFIGAAIQASATSLQEMDWG